MPKATNGRKVEGWGKKDIGGFAYRLNFAELVWSAGADKLTVLGEAFRFWPHALNRAEVHRNGSTQRLWFSLNKILAFFFNFRCWGVGARSDQLFPSFLERRDRH